MSARPGPGDGVARVDAPAKLNLGLRIVGQRADGYHLLESLFVPVDLTDRVCVELRGGPCDGEPAVELDLWGSAPGLDDAVPSDAGNLAVRAARAFLRERDLAALLPAPLRAIRIRLEKRIPVAAGLGGGSSDAAAVLRALLALAVPEGAHDPEALAAVALSVGADVPFFLDPAPAWVSGIGEVIAPIGDLPPLWLLLANPGISVATADVYGLWDHRFGRPAEPAPASGGSLTPEGAASTMPALSGLGGDPKALIRLLTALNGGAPGAGSRAPTIPNDLEAGAIRLCPPVARLRDRIGALEDALALGMSGSGATVYGVFASGSSAERAMAAACFESPVWARVVRSLGVAPRVEVERGAGQDPGASPNW